ncbi:ATP-binding domain-containing protein [Heliobacterium gestii]|uniref:ATP-binding domain-containing protein n=1 Tax=Heliomicrobium gestii TaxID=2699 RepID=A0A845LJ70_HELGE|nr:RNA polymerase recycling motor HelD [Heliomicrobium gestii]MBM7866281.1 DNA helicase-2/ATP-dependent DNA helicase PcrA [Heliomicrobium gestii]MZP42926.1 ATP-binding domain-containing protein [Heliomicrobium gestii]
MDKDQQGRQEELQYLEQTERLLQTLLNRELDQLDQRKEALIEARRDMWENTVHASQDFAQLTEMNQYLAGVNQQTAGYVNTLRQVEKYRRMIGAPYFGRFDFVEDGYDEVEKIYVGLHTLTDPASHHIFVYDWRAPVSSIFYRHEPGRAAYEAPSGIVEGDVLRKRQYKINEGNLVYFFDCNVVITDQILQEILSQNASPKMRTIVETIQKEQDRIIRDRDTDLLIVQGVAGSGKTSIALHRIAFLLYEGHQSRLQWNNVLILSPNAIFSQYISHVLPELGEENVAQTTFDAIATAALAEPFIVESRAEQLETLLQSGGNPSRQRAIAFKGSRAFLTLLDRLIDHWAHREIAFEDVYYDSVTVETGQQLKNRFLNNKIGLPMAVQLRRLEETILKKIPPLQKRRRQRIEKIVAQSEGRDFEIKAFSRLLSMKETKALRRRLHRFTRVDYRHLYERLFTDPPLFARLARGLSLPEGIAEAMASASASASKSAGNATGSSGMLGGLFAETGERLRQGRVAYEDAAPLLYLKFRLEGCSLYSDIKQVVIDEAQDYTPLQYAIFALLFKEARYTVLGDICQSVEREGDLRLYDDVVQILQKPKTLRLDLNKGYRSSQEISAFARRLLAKEQGGLSFERHDEAPRIERAETEAAMVDAVARHAAASLEAGFGTVAVICKSQREAERLHSRLKGKHPVQLIQPHEGWVEKGVSVVSAYLAKGLEFDAVIVYGADKGRYASDLDRRLLYIACTRALHRLTLCYCGEISPFLTASASPSERRLPM